MSAAYQPESRNMWQPKHPMHTGSEAVEEGQHGKGE